MFCTETVLFFCMTTGGRNLVYHLDTVHLRNEELGPTVPLSTRFPQTDGGLACQGPVNDCHILVTMRTNSQPQ
ncbi:hypothetical protein ACRRTK_011842 [Alexandromys fortis]